MVKYLLYKYSGKGWTKEFSSKDDARKELLSHICYDCLEGQPYLYGEEEVYPVNTNDIDSLLCTPCGCEFRYEEVDD